MSNIAQWFVSNGNLSEDATSALRFLRFWLGSIVVHARGRDDSLPQIALVGTHKDKVMVQL